jgi:hypothetical protein
VRSIYVAIVEKKKAESKFLIAIPWTFHQHLMYYNYLLENSKNPFETEFGKQTAECNQTLSVAIAVAAAAMC